MPQYQSFPDAAGDSRTLEKLKSLHLPVLEGRSFLDVGCNEGFFCGFAHFAGATRSVGVDRSSDYIARARARFPACEFRNNGWDQLPAGPFDVILLASALHYADDQPALLHRLVEHLSRDGVLVLELGIVSSQKSEWVKVKRGIDERWFPSLMKLREILEPYASKWMGTSVAQAGDPVARHVMHVSRPRPVAYLLMQPPTYGKTSLAKRLFAPTGAIVVSGDRQIARLASGEIDAPPALHEAAAQDFSRWRIDDSVERIFANGLGKDLVATWLVEAGQGDFAVDGYVPAKYHAEVRQCLVDAGYLPVVLDWERPGPALLEGAPLHRAAKAFYHSMRKRGAPAVLEKKEASPAATGFVDRLKVDRNGRLVIRGWARTGDDALPRALAIRVRDTITTVEDFERMARPDVQKRLGTAHDLFGFRVTMDAMGATSPEDLGEGFSVATVDGRPFRLTPGVAKLLKRH
jgi:SAM-dependent methyltransferase